MAGAVTHYMRSMAVDADQARLDQKALEIEQMIEAFEEALDGGRPLFQGRRMVLDDLPEETFRIVLQYP